MNITRTSIAIIAIAVVSMTATDLMAQGREGGRRGGFRGRGGFGGRGGDPAIGLLQIEEVRRELEMYPDQTAAIEKMQEQARESRREGGGFDFARMRDASKEERLKIMEELAERRREMEKETRKQLVDILMPDQLDRLDEISIQVQGVRALDSKKVAKALKITDAQKAKVEEIREQGKEKFRTAMREAGRENMWEKMAKFREDLEKSIMAVLTPEQQSQFEEMKGEPFEMPEREGFGGRGGRGGEAGPGGRGGFRGRGGDDGGRRRGSRRPEQDN